MGEYRYVDNEVNVSTIARLANELSGNWSYPEALSSSVVSQIRRFDDRGYEMLASGGSYDNEVHTSGSSMFMLFALTFICVKYLLII